jgi:hypothetical protein
LIPQWFFGRFSFLIPPSTSFMVGSKREAILLPDHKDFRIPLSLWFDPTIFQWCVSRFDPTLTTRALMGSNHGGIKMVKPTTANKADCSKQTNKHLTSNMPIINKGIQWYSLLWCNSHIINYYKTRSTEMQQQWFKSMGNKMGK